MRIDKFYSLPIEELAFPHSNYVYKDLPYLDRYR